MTIDLSKEMLNKMDLEITSIDIEELGLVNPRFEPLIEQKLAAVTNNILGMRKPYLYWKTLASILIALGQLTKYAQEANRDYSRSRKVQQDLVYASELTQKQVIHIANGGQHDAIPQSNFVWIKTDVFNRRKLNNPAHWLEDHGLIIIYPKEKSARKGRSISIKITNKGVWVFARLRRFLENSEKAHSLHAENTARYGPREK